MHTFDEPWYKTVCVFVHEAAIPCHANGCQDVVACNHDRSNVRLGQLLENSSSRRLQLVLENDETHKFEIALSLVALHFLAFDP